MFNKASIKSLPNKPILALCWICFFWGTTWIASKEGVKHLPAIQMCAIRQLIAGTAYLVYFIWKKHPWPKGKQWRTILVLSLLNFFLSNTLSTWGVEYIPSGLGAIIGAIVPLWIVIIGLFGGEKLPAKALIGIGVGFSGICVIFFDHLRDFLNADFRLGIALSVTASLSWAMGSLYTKKKAANFNPYFSLGLQMIISCIALFGISKASGNEVPLSAIGWKGWLCIAYLIVFGSVLTFIAYIYCLQRLPTSLASVYAYTNPMIAVILGAIVFGERLNAFVAVGGAITLIGVYLVNNSFRKSASSSTTEVM